MHVRNSHIRKHSLSTQSNRQRERERISLWYNQLENKLKTRKRIRLSYWKGERTRGVRNVWFKPALMWKLMNQLQPTHLLHNMTCKSTHKHNKNIKKLMTMSSLLLDSIRSYWELTLPRVKSPQRVIILSELTFSWFHQKPPTFQREPLLRVSDQP